jgi:N-succinyldiaminopimelate aminotransferase
VFVPQGTYFVTADVRPLGWADGLEFCRDLPHRAGVVAIPHQVFYDDVEAGRPLVRFAFCKRDEVLDDALDRLQVLRPQSG